MFHLNTDQESLKVITVQRVFNLFTTIDYWFLDVKLAQTDDINIYLKDSVLTTQSRTIIEDLKPKTKKGLKIISKNCMCFAVGLSQFNSRT